MENQKKKIAPGRVLLDLSYLSVGDSIWLRCNRFGELSSCGAKHWEEFLLLKRTTRSWRYGRNGYSAGSLPLRVRRGDIKDYLCRMVARSEEEARAIDDAQKRLGEAARVIERGILTGVCWGCWANE